MCGIAGFASRAPKPIGEAERILSTFNALLAHRGPDGMGTWLDSASAEDATCHVGLAHRRLSIIDLDQGAQPMMNQPGLNQSGTALSQVITFNGEIYNYLELRDMLGPERFETHSDTEVILKAYETWGTDCVNYLRGMFAFVIWDPERRILFMARDRFGIKPFYYCVQTPSPEASVFYFASEMKALLPFLERREIQAQGLADYFNFQFVLEEQTLFAGIEKLPPAHRAVLNLDTFQFQTERYWEVHYQLDQRHTEAYFVEQLREILAESVALHCRSDVEVSAYLSGGLDSSLISALARKEKPNGRFQAFTGKFSSPEGFDESAYARLLASENKLTLHEQDIHPEDFIQSIQSVIYHLDEPVAGPGSFPQYMVSKAVREHGVKVVLGGQGGDEIFGGYTRYLLAYFEQCIKGAIEGTQQNSPFIVTYESILKNLRSLKNYKPLIQEFWAEGLFDERDKRYFRLINRANALKSIIQPELLNPEQTFHRFQAIFLGENVGQESYFDSMTHFDFKTLLPALLQVEDRMSMAHSIESRVPFLDHPLVELVATIPANIKFKNGELKRLLKLAFPQEVPAAIRNREDKMGFPVPLQPWLKSHPELRAFVLDTFRSERAKSRPYLQPGFDIETLLSQEKTFTRNFWALLNLELWHQQFLDSAPGLANAADVGALPY